jgi:hypothetical protein
MIDNVDDDVAPVACSVCDTETPADDIIATTYGDGVCDECAITCDRCCDIGSTNDDFHTVDGRATWCESCTDRRAYWCELCSEYNSGGSTYIVDRQEHWCEGCCDDAYYCDDCDEWNASGCDRCDDETDGVGSRIIHDYSYRPDAIFHSTDKNERLFFGIEIEVEAINSKATSAMHAYQLEAMDLAYLKNDGSLQNGFEIVTHPMSHDFFKNEASDLWTILEDLRSNDSYKVKAWDTKTCGLHIHISRTGFSSGSHMHKFLNLVYSNPDFYSTLAGRTSDQWAKYTDIFTNEYKRNGDGDRIQDTIYGGYETIRKRTFAHKLDYNRHSDRYSAVNTLNHATLEMRIFRGTVNSDTIKAHLDLAHASVEYTRTLTVQDVREGALSADNFMWYVFQNEALYPELSARIDKLAVGLDRQNVSK